MQNLNQKHLELNSSPATYGTWHKPLHQSLSAYLQNGDSNTSLIESVYRLEEMIRSGVWGIPNPLFCPAFSCGDGRGLVAPFAGHPPR